MSFGVDVFCFFKQKTAYELRIRDWSSDVCSSDLMRDNWCIGWSQDYTVGVWVGNSGGASMRDVSGVSGAGPVWHDVMAYLHRSRSSVQEIGRASCRERVWQYG